MNKYIKGSLKNIGNPAVSLLTQIDHLSQVSRKAKVYGMAKLFDSSVDDYTYIGRKTTLVNAKVGKFCSIAGGCTIGMATHTLNHLSTSPIFTERSNALQRIWCDNSAVNPYHDVVVGNDVWIGARVMVMGGVTIGDGAVIGAGAIVTHDVPPYAIVAGVPARVKKYRFDEDTIKGLLEIQWWNLPEERMKENIELFQSIDVDMPLLKQLTEILGGG